MVWRWKTALAIGLGCGWLGGLGCTPEHPAAVPPMSTSPASALEAERPVGPVDSVAEPAASRSETPTETPAVDPGPPVEQPVRRPTEEELAAQQGPADPPPRPRLRRAGDKYLDITFDDLKLDMPTDSVFKPEQLTDRAKELDGKLVRIRGFISPGVFQLHGITEFPLLRNTECKFGPGGPAYHVMVVKLKEGLSTSFTVRPITVEGLIKIDPFEGPDGNTWSVYHLTGDKVEQ